MVVDTETGKEYAMKIMYVEDAEEQEDFDVRLFLVLMNNEVERLAKLPVHENIIQLIDHNLEDKVVINLVLELARGGDLFNYIFVMNKGFPEPIARYYFRQLIEAMEFMHNNNVVHRDLKLENLLLDENYKLKIADFGLSTTVESKYGGGVMYTRVGTERYMPPEMLEKNAYIGICTDLFAAGVILFVLVMGMMPTHKSAESNDYLYRYFRKREYEEYWTIVANILNIDLGTISEDYFHLVTTMIKYDFQRRFTIDEIKEHPWYNGPVATEEEVKEELNMRRQIINKRMSETQGEDSDDEPDASTVVDSHATAFEEKVDRGDDEFDDCATIRKIKVYDGTFPKLTEFFSTYKPNILLGAFVNFAKLRNIEMNLDNMQYKATVQMPSDEENLVDFTCEILKVKENSDEIKSSDAAYFADSDDED